MVVESLGIGHGVTVSRLVNSTFGVDLDMNDILSVHKTVRIQTMSVECQSFFFCRGPSFTIPFVLL